MIRHLAFALLLHVSFSTVAQFKNIRLDTLSALDDIGAPIAISQRDPLNMVAVSASGVSVTRDGGTTWQKKQIRSLPGLHRRTSVVGGLHGEFYLFHLPDPASGVDNPGSVRPGSVIVQVSIDGGETWTSALAGGGKNAGWPSAAIDGKGNLYLAWTAFDQQGSADPNCHSNILLSISRNGKRWSDPLQLSQTPGNCQDNDNTVAGAVPAVTPDGKIFVAWANQEKIFLDRSYDGGNVWLTNDIAVTQHAGGSNVTIPGLGHYRALPMLTADRSRTSRKGSLYLTWCDQRNGDEDTDIWMMRTTNFGDMWIAAVKVNDDAAGQHQFLPATCVDADNGNIYVVYYVRNDDDLLTDVYLAYSVDAGASFKRVRISEASFRLPGKCTGIAAHKGIITPAWTQIDENKTNLVTAVLRHDDLEKIK